ncbi:MAG TPA: alpha/beta hydrolase [Devosia sp.]
MVELARRPTEAGFETVRSADGTSIAYEVSGAGRPLLLIGGALNDRNSPIAGTPMVTLLADRYRVYAFDRRGRGNSGDTAPYAPEREIEDVAALARVAGEPVLLFGHSSGGGLALQAAASGVPVAKVCVYEPPYSTSAEDEAGSAEAEQHLTALLAAGERDAAVVFFMAMTGMPDEMIEEMKGTPFWAEATRIASSLAYDTQVMRMGGTSYVPATRIARIEAPVLAIAGERSPEFMREAGRQIAAAAPAGRYLEAEGQDHMVPADYVAGQLRSWFG